MAGVAGVSVYFVLGGNNRVNGNEADGGAHGSADGGADGSADGVEMAAQMAGQRVCR
jgi:hypothetical protein